MFKKIEIWILYLFLLLGIPLTISFGVLVRHEILINNNQHYKRRFGLISKTALFLAEIPPNLKIALSPKSDSMLVKDRFPLLDGFNGTPNLNESYLLLSRYDGDEREGIVELVDLMNFKVLHTWNPDLDAFNKSVANIEDFENLARDHNNSRSLLLNPVLSKDGSLVFHDSTPLRKIDSCSKLVFQNKHDRFHHSIERDIEGNFWVPSYMFPESLPIEKVGRKRGYYDDGIVKLSSDGEILFEKSVSQIFIDNGLEYLLFSTGDWAFTKDPIHLNDIQPVDFDGEFWKKGDVFLSSRNQSMVLLYRPSTNKIIWKGTGPFFLQHDVDILNEHTISLFNNNIRIFVDGKGHIDGNNEVITYDFKTNKYNYYLKESLIKNDVRTIKQGSNQILPNGDLFIEETGSGRILYFNKDGTLRWTYFNRANNGKIFYLGWSRIMYDEQDIQNVNKFLQSKGKCNN